MRRTLRVASIAILALTAASCARGSATTPAVSSSTGGAGIRVDLLEAGIRAVASHSQILIVQTRLCPRIPEEVEDCPSRITDDERAILTDRLDDLGDDIRFVPRYEDTYGTIPEKVTRDYIMLGVPQDRGDGTYWIEAGEVSCEMCAHGGTYVLERRDGVWVSTGNAPDTGQWVA